VQLPPLLARGGLCPASRAAPAVRSLSRRLVVILGAVLDKSKDKVNFWNMKEPCMHSVNGDLSLFPVRKARGFGFCGNHRAHGAQCPHWRGMLLTLKEKKKHKERERNKSQVLSITWKW